MAINDDYLGCKSYEGHDADPKNAGFVLFQNPKDSKYYFAYTSTDGKVLLRSEGYVDINSRTKGISSVVKNKALESRFVILEEGKKFYVILKAGNNKEIGRSCPLTSHAAAEKLLGDFGQILPSTAKPPAKKAADKKTTTASKNTNGVKVAEGKKGTTAVVTTEKAPKPSIDLGKFLEVNEYLEKERIWDSYGITGFVKFQTANGLHYFGVYNPDATLYLRSEGFTTESDRDATFDLMESIILLEENYKIENIGGKYYAVLFEDSDIVSISPAFNSFIEAFITTPGGRPREISGTLY